MAEPNRIDVRFADQAANGRKSLWPYVTAGLPDVETTGAILRALDAIGVGGVEVGIPFSDSIADGPVIQTSFARALDGGVAAEAIFEMVRSARREVSLPLIAMVSFSIVYRRGVGDYLAAAADAGFDGLIVPDLSLEEAPSIAEAAEAAGLRVVMLVAPTTPPERQERIARLSGGFVYYMSVAGITGERTGVPPELAGNVRRLRAAAGKPVAVGFGIARPEHVAAVCEVADAAIVGSAIVRRILEQIDAGAGRDAVVESVRAFADELQAPLKG